MEPSSYRDAVAVARSGVLSVCLPSVSDDGEPEVHRIALVEPTDEALEAMHHEVPLYRVAMIVGFMAEARAQLDAPVPPTQFYAEG